MSMPAAPQMMMRPGQMPPSPLGEALKAYRGAYVIVFLISAVVNLLMLVGPIYMLQVYDRVLTSGAVPTLVALTGLAIILYVLQSVLDALRGRILTRVATSFERRVSPLVFDVVVTPPRPGVTGADGLGPVRDLDSMKTYLSGQGPIVFFDLPWLPIYVACIWFLHPWLGMLAIGGGVIVMLIAWATDVGSRTPTRAAVGMMGQRNSWAEMAKRNSDVVRSMGMGAAVSRLFEQVSEKSRGANRSVSDVTLGWGAISRGFRLLLQSLMLGLGAYLVLQQQASPGAIIASSILLGRALAPVDLAVANWRGFVMARDARKRLAQLLIEGRRPADPTEIPIPSKKLEVDQIAVAAPDGQTAIIKQASFALEAGSALAVIGPSGGGKTTLMRALVGVLPTPRGAVRLDNFTYDRWTEGRRGSFIGYLPQTVELFEGTISQNIARFAEKIDDAAVVAAADSAGVTELISRFPAAFDTKVGGPGCPLSAGQRQRVALARALYKDPFLIVLDEPNAHLDAVGEGALALAIKKAKDRGAIVVVASHRTGITAVVDKVLVMRDGQSVAFGPRDEVLKKMTEQAQQAQRPAPAPAAAPAAPTVPVAALPAPPAPQGPPVVSPPDVPRSPPPTADGDTAIRRPRQPAARDPTLLEPTRVE